MNQTEERKFNTPIETDALGTIDQTERDPLAGYANEVNLAQNDVLIVGTYNVGNVAEPLKAP